MGLPKPLWSPTLHLDSLLPPWYTFSSKYWSQSTSQNHHLEKLDVSPSFTFFAQKTPDSYLWHPFRHLSSDGRAQFFASTWPTFAGLYQLGICVICLSFPARESQVLHIEELILFHCHLKIEKGKGRILLTKMFLRETGKSIVFKLQCHSSSSDIHNLNM